MSLTLTLKQDLNVILPFKNLVNININSYLQYINLQNGFFLHNVKQ